MTVSSIIGSDKTLVDLERVIKSDPNSVILVAGPSGRGKTWLATNLMNHVQDAKYCYVYLTGDSSRVSETYYPLKQFVEKKDRIRSKGLAVIKQSLGELPYVGKGIHEIIKDHDFKPQKKTIQDISPLKEHRDFSLHLLGLNRKYEKVIVICDDIEEFDAKTITYLADLKSGFSQLDESFNISFVFIVNSKVNWLHQSAFGITSEIDLVPLDQFQIRELVKFWSAKEVSTEQLALISSCSGGHLTLLRLIADHFKEAQELGTYQSERTFFSTIIDARLRKHSAQYEILKNLLQSIQKSGKQSTTYEMLCLLGDEYEIRELIQQAVQMDLLEIKDNYVHFRHPMIENYVASLTYKFKTSFYDQLGSCIKKLTPSNYSRRAFIEQQIKNSDRADIYWALASIKKMREGAFSEADVIRTEISNSHFGTNVNESLDQFNICYRLSYTGEIDNTLLEIEQIPNALPIELVAEKNFLKCDSLAKKISKAPKEEALNIISSWEEIKDTEPEIWYRLMQLRIITAAESGLLELAKKTEAEVVKYFSARLSYDIHARSVLEKLNLFSEVIYTPEIAHRKMLQAEKWLSKELDQEQFHRIIDLFIARVNLSSNSILIDEMEKAIQYATGAISLAENFDQIPFPGIEVPLSNYYLALLWTGGQNLSEIIKGYRKIYQSTYIEENKILFEINYAGLLMLNQQIEASFEVLKKGTYVPDMSEDDSYYCYYYWSNYCLIAFLMGNADEARKRFLELESIAQNVSAPLKKYYVRHFEILKDVLHNGEITSYKEVQLFFEKEQPVFISKIWNRFKCGYLLTDIQIWGSS